MSRPAKVLLMASATISVAAFLAACGTEHITVPRSQTALYQGAVLFSQRCSGCHTLSYASTHGSSTNVRTREITNGPNFNVRCERPVTRVLYAIENGGFSGAIMPQNVVVGQDAMKVAQFVATYAGRQSPKVPGVPTCTSQPVGALPAAGTPTSTTPTATTATKPAATTKTKAKPAATTKTTAKPAPKKKK